MQNWSAHSVISDRTSDSKAAPAAKSINGLNAVISRKSFQGLVPVNRALNKLDHDSDDLVDGSDELVASVTFPTRRRTSVGGFSEVGV